MAVCDPQIRPLLPEFMNGKTHEQFMARAAASDEQNRHHYIDGKKFPFVVSQENFDALAEFESREDDVLCCGYVRSGNHWQAEILQMIMNDGRKDFDRSFLSVALEMTLPTNPSTMTGSMRRGYEFVRGIPSPRLMGSHSPECFLPPQMFNKGKVVYIARNPKDMIVSAYKQLKALQSLRNPLEFDELLWEFYNGQGVYGSWFDHVLGYWERRDHPNILFLKYEDLHKDLRGWVRRIAQHLGKDHSDDVIDSITEAATFGQMQRAYQKYEDEGGESAILVTRALGVVPFLSKGVVGTWKDTFTVAQSALFDKIYAQKMEGTGLEFDFEL